MLKKDKSKTKIETIVGKILQLLEKEENNERREVVFNTFKQFLLQEENINLELIYQLCVMIYEEMPALKITDLEQAIVDSKSPKYNYLYARDICIPIADFNAHSEVVLSSKDPEYNLLFQMLPQISCKNIASNKHLGVIIDLNDAKRCVRYIEKAGISSGTAVKFFKVAIETNDAELCFAVYNSGLIKSERTLSEAAMQDDDGEFNYRFALEGQKFDRKGHGEAVIRSKNLKFNYYFAKNIVGADIKGHAQVIIDSKDKEMNYKFANDVVGADVQAHYQAVKDNINDVEKGNYDYLFEQDKEISDVKQLILSLNCEKPKRKKNGEI